MIIIAQVYKGGHEKVAKLRTLSVPPVQKVSAALRLFLSDGLPWYISSYISKVHMAVDWVYLELGRPDWIGRLPAACAAGPHRTLQSFVTVFCTEPDTKIQTPMQSKTIVAGGCLGGFLYIP